MEKLLTVDEVSQLTRLSKATLYAYVCRRKIPFYKLGSRTMFRPEEIEQWISDRSVKTLSLSDD